MWVSQRVYYRTMTPSNVLKWKKAVYNDKAFAAWIANLSTTFYCLNHEILIAKLIP